MAKTTIQAKLDHFNRYLAHDVLKGCGLTSIDKFNNHKQADQHLKVLAETIAKVDGVKVEWANDLPFITTDTGKVADKPEDKPEDKKSDSAPDSTPAPAAETSAKIKVHKDKETSELISAVVAAEDIAGAMWYRTGAWIVRFKGEFKEGPDSAKENRGRCFGLLDENSGDAVPEKGVNYKGQEINLRKQSGAVKWSAWEKTRRWTQNLSEIFKAIEVSGWDAVFPNGKLVDRPTLIKLGKVAGPGETPMQTIQRCLDLVMKKLPDIVPDKGNKLAIDNLVKDLLSNVEDWKQG